MSSLGLAVAMAIVGRTPTDALLTSLVAMSAAIDVVERSGCEVEVVIADATADPIVSRVLAGVQGATIIEVPGGSSAQAWAQACKRTSAAAVLLTSADAAISVQAMHLLEDALQTNPAAAAAVPHPDPGAYVVVRRDALGPDDDVAGVVERLQGEGAAIALVRGAGAVRQPRRAIVSDMRFPGVISELVGPGTLTTGEATYVGPGSIFKTYAPSERIELGAYCSVADRVRFIAPGDRYWGPDGEELQLRHRGAHRAGAATTFPIGILVPDAPFDEVPSDASGEAQIIGNDVWIGYGATILGGVTVGSGAIVGACSLVRSDVAPFTIVGGCPARKIRMRFTENVVERLQRIQWWDWPPEIVRANWWWFTRPAQEFVRRFDPAAGVASAT